MTSVAADAVRRPGLRANRDFLLVLSGQAVSALGDAITLTVMPLLVLFLTGSGSLMAIVAVLQLVPNLVLGLPAGALADRWDRRRLMMWSDAGRAVLTAAIPVSYWLGLPTMAVILIAVSPINVLRVLSDAAYTSAIPALVGREHLARANGYLEATLSVPFIAGPALAGLLVAVIGAPSTIAIDAASFALSAASLVLVRRSLRAERPSEMPSVVSDIQEGVRFVLADARLRSVIAYFAVVTGVTAALLPALAYYLTVDRAHGAVIFGLVGSTWSAGYLLGSILGGRLGGKRAGARILACGVGIGTMLILLTASGAVALYLIAAFVIGAALAVQLVSYMTLRASITPDELLGRVGSTARTVALGLQPLGLLAGGALLDAAGGGGTLLTMGLAAVGASLLFGLSRTLRDAGY